MRFRDSRTQANVVTEEDIMTFSKDQLSEFEILARPLMQFLAENCNPHTTVILDSMHAEIVAGIAVVNAVAQ